MDADINLEDGEIIDDCDDIGDCDDNYTPLERPTNYASTLLQARIPTTQELESEEEGEVDSSSDSDSDSDAKMKRPRLKLKPQRCVRNGSRRKYDIWSTHVQEDVLLENLVNCDVTRKDRSRNVETYPLPPDCNKLSTSNRKSNKRTNRDRNNSSLRLYKDTEITSDANGDVTGVSRIILDVTVTIENTDEDVAKDIANKLYEEKEDLICTIVKVAGRERALEFFKETKRIEEGGGMLIMNQTRRRTPGGVFLFLVKHDTKLTRDQLNEIFKDERNSFRKEVRMKRKMKLKQIKEEIAASRKASEQNVPELLSRADLCVQLEEKDRVRRRSDDIDVKNPPPSPVTDGHDNSNDDMENMNKDFENACTRNIINYEEDCLDVGIDMDLF